MTTISLNLDWLGNEVLALLLSQLGDTEEGNEQLDHDYEVMADELAGRMEAGNSLLLQEIAESIPQVMRDVLEKEKAQFNQWVADMLRINEEAPAP